VVILLLTYNLISVMYDKFKPRLSGSACDEPFGCELGWRNLKPYTRSKGFCNVIKEKESEKT
jgi:hypothetical protein